MSKLAQEYEVLETKVINVVMAKGSNGATLSEICFGIGLSDTAEHRRASFGNFTEDVVRFVMGKMALKGITVNHPTMSTRVIMNPNYHRPAQPVPPSETVTMPRSEFENMVSRMAYLEKQMNHLYQQLGYIKPQM